MTGESSRTDSGGGCSSPNSPAAKACRSQFVQIPGATILAHGGSPFTVSNTVGANTLVTCDRMCGKKFCLGRGLCKDSTNHAVIYSRRVPFELRVNFDPTGGFPQEQHNKGFKLNFFQLPC